MNVFIFKGKYLFLALLCLVAVLSCFLGVKTTSVFKSGERNIPVYSVKRDDNLASISFNCAWNDSDIDSILKTLDLYNVKATFFIVGDWAEKYPDALKKISGSGHEIGGHSYNHKDYAKLSEKEIIKDINQCDLAISSVINQTPKLYRVPSGSYNNSAISTLEDNEKIAIQWSCDSIDYNDATAQSIYDRSIKLENGGILLMHNGTKNTAVALPRILDNLCKRFTLVPIGELIYYDNFSVDATGKMYLK